MSKITKTGVSKSRLVRRVALDLPIHSAAERRAARMMLTKQRRKRKLQLATVGPPTTGPHTRQASTVSNSGRSRTAHGAKVEPTLVQLANELLDDPKTWFMTPNPRFGGRRPIELIGTDKEVQVHNLFRAVDQGLF